MPRQSLRTAARFPAADASQRFTKCGRSLSSDSNAVAILDVGGRAPRVARAERAMPLLRSALLPRWPRALHSGRDLVDAVARLVASILAARRAVRAGELRDARRRAGADRSHRPEPRMRGARPRVAAGARSRARPPRSRAATAPASRWCRGATRRIRRRLPRSPTRRRCLWAARQPRGAVTRRPSRSSARGRARRTALDASPSASRPISRRAASSIVSGLARGVDSAAHRGALAANGSTLAVLGSGADVDLSGGASRSRARDIEADGADRQRAGAGHAAAAAVLSAAQPHHQRAVARGRSIVEAGEKSGSLITARCALEQGRDVLAVPGNVLSGRNRGGHALLRDGAKIVESADDILEELGMPRGPAGGAPTRPSGAGRPRPAAGLSDAGEPCDLDAIAERSGLQSVAAAAAAVRARTAGSGAARRRRPVRPGLTDRARVKKAAEIRTNG